jgi:hypothetical protein
MGFLQQKYIVRTHISSVSGMQWGHRPKFVYGEAKVLFYSFTAIFGVNLSNKFEPAQEIMQTSAQNFHRVR